jgi:hypothetical protein
MGIPRSDHPIDHFPPQMNLTPLSVTPYTRTHLCLFLIFPALPPKAHRSGSRTPPSPSSPPTRRHRGGPALCHHTSAASRILQHRAAGPRSNPTTAAPQIHQPLAFASLSPRQLCISPRRRSALPVAPTDAGFPPRASFSPATASLSCPAPLPTPPASWTVGRAPIGEGSHGFWSWISLSPPLILHKVWVIFTDDHSSFGNC